MSDDLLPGTFAEPGGWVRVGCRRTGPVMRSYGFMRVERCANGWRAWDVLRVSGRATHPTTVHPTLAAAKAHCEEVVAGTYDPVVLADRGGYRPDRRSK